MRLLIQCLKMDAPSKKQHLVFGKDRAPTSPETALVAWLADVNGMTQWLALFVPENGNPQILGHLLQAVIKKGGMDALLEILAKHPPLATFDELLQLHDVPESEIYPLTDWLYLVGARSSLRGKPIRLLGLYKPIPLQDARSSGTSSTGVAWRPGYTNACISLVTEKDSTILGDDFHLEISKCLKPGVDPLNLSYPEEDRQIKGSRPSATGLIASLKDAS